MSAVERTVLVLFYVFIIVVAAWVVVDLGSSTDTSGPVQFISEMPDAGRDEMCEVWSQNQAAVVERFQALGFEGFESFNAVRETCS